ITSVRWGTQNQRRGLLPETSVVSAKNYQKLTDYKIAEEPFEDEAYEDFSEAYLSTGFLLQASRPPPLQRQYSQRRRSSLLI
ncbi:MAG TPA: hypothetical protein VLA64_07000, partial [Azonexus sp.]|nr:hypothetical protein [Azonexus sp.]